MEIFRLFESTLADVQPGSTSNKNLRRDQLLNNYDEATEALQLLIRAKENEITYRRDLIKMLEKSKVVYDNKLKQAKQAYQDAKSRTPNTSEFRDSSSGSSSKRIESSQVTPSTTTPIPMTLSTTPPLPTTMTPSSIPSLATTVPTPIVANQMVAPFPPGNSQQQQSPFKSSEFDIPMPSESTENRTSLDRRLSEFLKTFPNLTQAGLATTNNTVSPMPGYYTQQPPPPPPSSMSIVPPTQTPISVAPPMMAMMQFPPPPLVPASSSASSGSSSSKSSSNRSSGGGRGGDRSSSSSRSSKGHHYR